LGGATSADGFVGAGTVVGATRVFVGLGDLLIVSDASPVVPTAFSCHNDFEKSITRMCIRR
jgi:hypothetical protein